MKEAARKYRIERRADRKTLMARLQLHGWGFVSYWLLVHESRDRSYMLGNDKRVQCFGPRVGWPGERVPMEHVPNKNFWPLVEEVLRRESI